MDIAKLEHLQAIVMPAEAACKCQGSPRCAKAAHRSEAAGRPMARLAQDFDKLSPVLRQAQDERDLMRSPVLRYLRTNGFGLRYLSPNGHARNARLNKAKVRPHASFAAASSNRGVVSLLKPCSVPG